jgi:hypothetical protein
VVDDGKTTELTDQLEAALAANDIQVPDGAIQQLLDEKEWIYPSKCVQDLLKKLSNEQLYYVFNYQHNIQPASLLFAFLKDQGSCVVYGHKTKGKTQFPFFLFKLLQAIGEKVLFMDRTLIPLEYNNRIGTKSGNFCGNLWREDFAKIDARVKDTLDQFYRDAHPDSFGAFLFALWERTLSSGSRIWIIVDEVAMFEKFPIRLPEEQDLGPFHWIVTGSAGIGSWVAKRHLEKLVFDLPLFTKAECFEFANLCNPLGINLENAIDGAPFEGIDDWLEERFGGVVGYIAEMFLEILKGELGIAVYV